MYAIACDDTYNAAESQVTLLFGISAAFLDRSNLWYFTYPDLDEDYVQLELSDGTLPALGPLCCLVGARLP